MSDTGPDLVPYSEAKIWDRLIVLYKEAESGTDLLSYNISAQVWQRMIVLYKLIVLQHGRVRHKFSVL